MVRLLIIADDFTGALDTGVQFAHYDGEVKIIANPDCSFSSISPNIPVVVINADTRHLNKDDSYKVVFDIAKRASDSGFTHFYKKVDSGLRGNIGSELSALLDALDVKSLYFAPAYPKLKRVTVDGYQYIDGRLLSQSVFAKDLFNPPSSDNVIEIIATQTDKNIVLDSFDGEGIHVFNAKNDEELEHIAKKLGTDGLRASAGCAGFASHMAKILGFKETPKVTPVINSPILIVCGSINPISMRQMDRVMESGVMRFSLSTSQKTDPDWIRSEECSSLISDCVDEVSKNGCAIIDVNGSKKITEEDEEAQKYGLTINTLRQNIANLLGNLTKRLIDSGLDIIVYSIGGDTLKAIINALSINEINAVCELDAGVVLNSISYEDKSLFVISKSGGFGDENTVLNFLNALKGARNVV